MVRKIFIVIAALLVTFVTQTTVAKEKALQPRTIFIAGDSTAARSDSEERQGWAAMLHTYFNTSKVNIENRARGGRSSRTFINEGLWQKLVDSIQPGDLVLIQFGHNDGGPINDDHRARGSIAGTGNESQQIHNLVTDKVETVYTFGHYIRQMIKDVKAKNGVPILLSLTVRNIWQGERIERGSGQYGYWMREIAVTQDVPYIDVTNPVADELETLGKENTAALYPKDHTHFAPSGAEIHARHIVAAIKGLRPGLPKSWFSQRGDKITPYGWTFVRLPVIENANFRSVFTVGDSTVRNGRGDGRNGQRGWGSFLFETLPTNTINIVNRAVGGLSSRTYVTGGHWQRALNMMKPGDIVLIQFGHNDAGPLNDDSRARGTIKGVGREQQTIQNQLTHKQEVVHTYGWYLRKMIGEARAQGVIPIVCSPVPRNIWTEDDLRVARAKDSYPQWAEYVARQSQTPFIDLHQLVAEKYDQLGQEQVKSLFGDAHTHTSEAGAKLTAAIVTERLRPLLGFSNPDSYR